MCSRRDWEDSRQLASVSSAWGNLSVARHASPFPQNLLVLSTADPKVKGIPRLVRHALRFGVAGPSLEMSPSVRGLPPSTSGTISGQGQNPFRPRPEGSRARHAFAPNPWVRNAQAQAGSGLHTPLLMRILHVEQPEATARWKCHPTCNSHPTAAWLWVSLRLSP